MNAKPTAHTAQSISQTLNHMGKLSMSREVTQLGKTIESQAETIRELTEALQEYLSDHTATAKAYLTSNPTQCDCVTCRRARAALEKVSS